MEWMIILLLVLINGFFSMAEMAVVASRKSGLATALKDGRPGSNAAWTLKQSPTHFLSTVQIGITLVGVLTGIYSGEKFTRGLTEWLAQFDYIAHIAGELAVMIVLLAITSVTLILGELVPKRVGLTRPEAIALRIAPFMQLLSRLAYPFVWLLTATSEALVKLLRLRSSGEHVTEEEIKAIVQEGTLGGEVALIERDIVERVFALGDRTIASLMTTRNDIAFIDLNADDQTVVTAIDDDLHRLYPVIDGEKDNIVGVVHLKDMFRALAAGRLVLRELLRPAYFLSESVSAYAALEKFRRARTHYALVTNEYGMVMGLVTVDDILRALVGDVYDPDERDAQVVKRADGSFLIDGEFPLVEFNMLFDLERMDGMENINTVAGLVLRIFDRIPRTGERIRWKHFEFEVIDLDKVRIDKVLVRKIESDVPDTEP